MAKKKRKRSQKQSKSEKSLQSAQTIDQQFSKLKTKEYEAALYKLHVELVKLQEWVVANGERVVIVFEGRDTAGKGGVIKRITERVSPRVFRVVALPTPTDREKSQLYLQRYVQHFPAAGEVVLFDRSWYNRAGVERVMNFCTKEQYKRFLVNCPMFEQYMVNDGIRLIKYWFDIDQEVQLQRLQKRISDERKTWKLSPMDVKSFSRWYDYSRARDDMFAATDTDHAPWHIVPANSKKHARLNCISHLLSMIPYKEVQHEKVVLPKRDNSKAYDDNATLAGRNIIPRRY